MAFMAEKAEQENNIPVIESSFEDEFLVKFNLPFDSENPKDWSMLKKLVVSSMLSITGFNRIMVSTMMSPALTIIGHELQMSDIESVMALSVYLLASAFGPLLIGPLSEVYGRQPVLHASSIWFLIWNIVCGFANSKELLVAARFLAGFGASAIYALSSGVLGDIWPAEQRGRSLSIYILIPMVGAAVGPIIGGYIAQYTTWRWLSWSTSILQAVMILLSLPLFHESYAPILLGRRTKRLREETGDARYHTELEKLDAGRSVWGILQNSLTRPARLLLFHPIIQVQSCLSAFNYGILYLQFKTFSELFINQYNLSVSASSLHYLAIVIGEIQGALICGLIMDFAYRRFKHRVTDPNSLPESRVLIMIPGALLGAAALLMYGWAAEKRGFWLIVDIGAALLALGMQFEDQIMQAYVIESYPDHTSSASAASQFLRGLAAFGFPLFAPNMYQALGYGWGNTLLAFLLLGLGIAGCCLVWFYGTTLRAKKSSSY